MIFEATYFRAFQFWKRSASQNYPAARLRLGDHYWYGHGVQQNLNEAANYYRIVSEENDAQSAAQVNIFDSILIKLFYMF